MTDSQDRRKPRLARIRIVSLEGGLAAFGIFSLGSGLFYGELLPVFWGVTILAGLGILSAVRRRDWKKHWEEVGAQRPSSPAPKDPGPPSA
jgi:hypothetical protein